MQLKERALAKSGTTVPKYVAIAPVIASWLFSRLSDYSATHVSVSARFSRKYSPCAAVAGIILMPELRRAFFARRRGRERCDADMRLIRAGGQKTCWTEPAGRCRKGPRGLSCEAAAKVVEREGVEAGYTRYVLARILSNRVLNRLGGVFGSMTYSNF